MVIPESQVGRYGCHVTRVRPPAERAPCCGPKCAAWTRVYAAGQCVSAFDGRNRLIATESLGRCALLPISMGTGDDDAVTSELRARKAELLAAGVLKYEPVAPRPNPPRVPTPAELANDIF